MHCGLDFGTSNSTLGITLPSGAPQLLPLEGDRLTMPSVIFFSFEDGEVYFGREAMSEYISGAEGRIMRALKSVLGTPLMEDVTRIKARQLPFAEILGLFLARLRRHAEGLTDKELSQVVVGRPVHFVDEDPVADRQAQDQLEAAVRAQGFRHVEFQFEPIAAALDYERQVDREELALVVDIGGGTSDFSVVRVSPERARAGDRKADILAAAGVHVGGTDFDRLLSLAKAMPRLGYQTPTADGKRVLPSAPYYDLATWHRINRLYSPAILSELRQTRREARFPERVDAMLALVEDRQGHALAAAVEETKIALTDAPSAELAFAARGVALQEPVTREDLGAALAAAVGRIGAKIAETLALAGVGAGAVQTLILTGGSTQVPAVAAELRRLFPATRFVATDAFGSVGLGLAIDAARRF